MTIHSILKELKIEAHTVIPIGHHDLKRHFVYELVTGDVSNIIKVYYKPHRLKHELSAYEYLKDTGLDLAVPISYGTLSNGQDYLLLTKLKGKNMTQMPVDFVASRGLYAQLGQLIGQIHTSQPLIPYPEYKSLQKQRTENYMMMIRQLALPKNDVHVLIDAYESYLGLIDQVDFGDILKGFCHHDFCERNILVDEETLTVSGIVDFEIADFGNPEYDLSCMLRGELLTNLPLREAFLNGYQCVTPISPNFEARLPLYFLADGISNCSWAFEQAPRFYKENIALLSSL